MDIFLPSCGLVERLHRQLKALFKAYNNQCWTETLTVVLLGIRTTVKADIGCCTAELVFGTTIKLPGQFVAPSMINTDMDPSDYVQRLKQHMTHLRPTPKQDHSTNTLMFILNCRHVHMFLFVSML